MRRSSIQSLSGNAVILVVAILCSGNVYAQSSSSPGPPGVLSQVRAKVESYLGALPSFSCTEQILSEQVENGRTSHQIRMQSQFRVKRSEKISAPLSEERNVESVNGKAAPKQLPHMPLLISGAFGNSLALLLDKGFTSCYAYTADTGTMPSGMQVEILHLAVSNAADPPCNQLAADARIDLWLDPGNMDLLRIDKHFPHTTTGEYGNLQSSVSYAVVKIGDQNFLLPHVITATLSDPKNNKSVRYIANYTDYHRYEVSATIVPASPGDADGHTAN